MLEDIATMTVLFPLATVGNVSTIARNGVGVGTVPEALELEGEEVMVD